MNWKVFITACVSAALISFPQNMIGCGGETDPYDYYSSFFHNNLPDAKGYQPFYYTSYNFLYDWNEPTSVAQMMSSDWAAYCGVPVADKDAYKFVNKFAWKDLNNLYSNIKKGLPLKLPDSVKANAMTHYFLQKKDLEALGYLMYAKQVEPFMLGGADSWDAPKRDSIKMAKLISNGQQLYSAVKLNYFKLKYAYQILRLAHYSGRYADVIKWYDNYELESNESSSVMLQLCTALKAGALFHTGQNKEAAYLFSKVFSASDLKRVSNYLGFVWSYKNAESRTDYLKLCKNDAEQADMIAMFTLNSVGDELPAMKEVFKLEPSAAVLEVMAVREINKLEEKYLTPAIQKQPGSLSSYSYYASDYADSIVNTSSSELNDLPSFFHKVAQSGLSSNSGLFEVAAAYAAYMHKDFTQAKKYANTATTMSLTQKVRDQLMLTDLLISISSKPVIDKNFEEEMLPSIQWLLKKATSQKIEQIDGWDVAAWRVFYRNLMTDVLAKRYHAQNDLQKEALCIGASRIAGKESPGSAIDFLRSKFSSAEVEKMFALLDSKHLNKFELFLTGNNVIKKSTVIDFAGTAYLRDYNYDKAIEWFNKTADKKSLTIGTNPFIDLLYDQEAALPVETKFKTSKLAFAQEMKRLLSQQSGTDKIAAAKAYYKYALGLYNMTYYGHAWQLVEYDRSGSDGYFIPKDATEFKKEYYGAFSALKYFEKAMDAATDMNLKARCLFMMAKCSQKQLQQPKYQDYTGNLYSQMDVDNTTYEQKFRNNQYFPQLVKDYSNTAFYKEAFNSCSYLRDFVKKK